MSVNRAVAILRVKDDLEAGEAAELLNEAFDILRLNEDIRREDDFLDNR